VEWKKLAWNPARAVERPKNTKKEITVPTATQAAVAIRARRSRGRPSLAAIAARTNAATLAAAYAGHASSAQVRFLSIGDAPRTNAANNAEPP